MPFEQVVIFYLRSRLLILITKQRHLRWHRILRR